MKKLQYTQDFEYPLETLLEYNHEQEFQKKQLADGTKIKLISQKQEGTKIHKVRRINIGDNLPTFARPLLPADFEFFIEHSTLDEQTHTRTFTVSTKHEENSNFYIKGKSQYEAIDADHSRRTYDLEINVKAFLVGPLIEEALANLCLRGIEKDRDAMIKSLLSSSGGKTVQDECQEQSQSQQDGASSSSIPVT